MAIYIFNKATGALVSYCPSDDDQVAADDVLAEKGLAKLDKQPPLDERHVWDETTARVHTIQPIVLPNIIDNYRFILSFMPQEYDAIKKSPDLNVQLLLEALRSIGQIDLNGATTRNALAYLVAVGLLTQERSDTVLAGDA